MAGTRISRRHVVMAALLGSTALLATRVIVDVLGTLVSHGKMGAHKAIIDKPVTIPPGPDY